MVNLLSSISLLAAFFFAAQDSATLTIKGFGSTDGKLFLQVRNAEDDILFQDIFEIEGTSTTVTLPVFSQDVMIRLFHDEDGNKKMNKNLVGYPLERFGFSNDAFGTFGPPDFEDAAIRLTPGSSHEINLKEL